MTRSGAWGAMAALGLLLTGTAPAQDHNEAEKQLKLAEREPEFINRVNAAVVRAVAWLKAKQLADGTWASHYDNYLHGPWRKGMTAYTALTLIRSGMNPTDETVEKAIAHLRERWENWKAGGSQLGQPESWKCYEVACMLMALEARWNPPLAFLRKLMQGTQAAGAGAKVRVPAKDLQWIKELAAFLQTNLGISHTEVVNSSKGSRSVEYKDTWSYPSEGNTLSDRSNTQFAVLGLQAAARCGIQSDDGLWKGVLRNFIEFQDRKGEKMVPKVVAFEDKKNPGYIRYRTVGGGNAQARGWNYYCGKHVDPAGDEWHRAIGSMTTVGISVVAICLEQLQNLRKCDASDRKDAVKAITDGLAWLDYHFAVDKHPGHEPPNEQKNLYYYLYGLERAAVSADTALIGAHDWYGEGAEWLLKNQQGEGFWAGDHNDSMAATCFALLFLTKGTVPPNIGVQISGVGH